MYIAAYSSDDICPARAVINILTVCLAATVPWLDLLVSLVGAVTMSSQSIMLPAIIDSAAHWNSDSRSLFLYRSVRNSLTFTIGCTAALLGTYISTLEICKNFREGQLKN